MVCQWEWSSRKLKAGDVGETGHRWSNVRTWEGLGTGAQVKLALAQSWILTHSSRREEGALVELAGAPFHSFYFSASEGTRSQGDCAMLVVVGRCGMSEDRKKGRNRNLEE